MHQWFFACFLMCLLGNPHAALAQPKIQFESAVFSDLSETDRNQIAKILVESNMLAEEAALVVPDAAQAGIAPKKVGDKGGESQSWSVAAVAYPNITAPEAQASAICLSSCSSFQSAAIAACGVMKGKAYLACLAAVAAAQPICEAACWFKTKS